MAGRLDLYARRGAKMKRGNRGRSREFAVGKTLSQYDYDVVEANEAEAVRAQVRRANSPDSRPPHGNSWG